MQLYTQVFPADARLNDSSAPPLLIVPGLFGSTTNWRVFAKTVAADYPVVVVDQRNHGRSPHADSNSYFDMAADLLELLEREGIEKVHLCGHSMGGKTAMVFSLLHPDKVVTLAVLDIAPVVYEHSHAPFLEELLKIDLTQLASRSEADRALRSTIPDLGTRMFLLQNLSGSPKSYKWRINIEVLHREMPTIVGFPTQNLIGQQGLSKTLVIVGEDSNYVKVNHHDAVRRWFPKAEFGTIAKAGHWLHVEQPAAVIRTLLSFLKKT